jgi:hypothetical protein
LVKQVYFYIYSIFPGVVFGKASGSVREVFGSSRSLPEENTFPTPGQPEAIKNPYRRNVEGSLKKSQPIIDLPD